MWRMPFGKHRGELLEDIPTDYLRWVLRTVELRHDGLKEAIEEEVEERGHGSQHGSQRTWRPPPPPPPPPPPREPDWLRIINRWHRDLVLEHHPDRGGDVRVMQVLNDAVDRLRKLVGV